jgi:alpha-N-arabinofuranosidase
LSGAKLASTAKLVSLIARDTQETNSIIDPIRIVPVRSTIPGVNSRVHHMVPAYSIQVIQFSEE